ncbi:uncharacterized protein [Dendrobates tinctorius]|uniref:uncharacterized protein n=1 Tax=Dendrobates tinctorius TaxID=92724 RepID=UPI003CC9DAB9
MSRWSKKGPGRGALLPLLLLALALGGTSLVLASLNLLLTTTSWGHNLCHGRAQHQRMHPVRDPSADTQIYYQNIWEKHQLLYQKLTEDRSRHKRSANGNRKNKHNNRKSSTVTAAHYEVKKGGQVNADDNGTILDWTEVQRNSTSPVRYDDGRGEFVVNVKGLFYLYCQVHFNEDRSSYIKLDLLLDGKLIFRCLQEFSATAASIRDPTLKTCSVSGLVILRPGNSLRIKTLPKVSLRVDSFLTYFGLFQEVETVTIKKDQKTELTRLRTSVDVYKICCFSFKSIKDYGIQDSLEFGQSIAKNVMTHTVMVNVVPSLARGLWGGTGSWLGVLLCLIALVYQSIHLGSLQRELSIFQKSKEQSRLEVQRLCEAQLCSRQKRDVPGTKKRRHAVATFNFGTAPTAGNRSLLHLVPQSIYSDDSQDCTEISWKVSLQEGRSLEVEGKSVQVKHSGIYSIYSQVFYTDTTYTMGHIILRQTDGDTEDSNILLRCVQSMPADKSLAFNTCYTSGIKTTHENQKPENMAEISANGTTRFGGLIRLLHGPNLICSLYVEPYKRQS